ncbi:hypothetical protein SLS62_011066 [Diatrype stigma]|uniref:Uncharacterized protein n=1 Tax=Diatrype stigma TaxID=117547 RepID=A0AAN9U8M6_9PEZI
MSQPPNSTKNPMTPARSHKKGHRVLKPNKQSPAKTENQVRDIVKSKYPDYDKVAVALAPIFGLGSDLIAGQRAQGLFKHRPFLEAFAEFADVLLEGRWDVPVASWVEVIKAVPSREGTSKESTDWSSLKLKGQHRDVNDHYACFLARAMHDIRHPTKSTQLVYWIKEADVEDGYWVLFHALMYLQLEAMREYRRRAPIKDRINHMLGRQ